MLELTGGKVDLDYSVLERLADLAAVYPTEAVASLRLIATEDREGSVLAGTGDLVRRILATAISSNRSGARDTATDLIHFLGARGFSELRTLLSPSGTT
jgi:hypothetical protein